MPSFPLTFSLFLGKRIVGQFLLLFLLVLFFLFFFGGEEGGRVSFSLFHVEQNATLVKHAFIWINQNQSGSPFSLLHLSAISKTHAMPSPNPLPCSKLRSSSSVLHPATSIPHRSSPNLYRASKIPCLFQRRCRPCGELLRLRGVISP